MWPEGHHFLVKEQICGVRLVGRANHSPILSPSRPCWSKGNLLIPVHLILSATFKTHGKIIPIVIIFMCPPTPTPHPSAVGCCLLVSVQSLPKLDFWVMVSDGVRALPGPPAPAAVRGNGNVLYSSPTVAFTRPRGLALLLTLSVERSFTKQALLWPLPSPSWLLYPEHRHLTRVPTLPNVRWGLRSPSPFHSCGFPPLPSKRSLGSAAFGWALKQIAVN